MFIGEKIKNARLNKKMTQAELVQDKITRNMLSAIESGKALPSLDTIYFIAERLDIPAAYFLSEDDDLYFFKKKCLMPEIKAAFSSKKYKECVDMITSVGGLDDELNYILASCYYEIGVSNVMFGDMLSAVTNLDNASKACAATMYDTRKYEIRIPLYISLTKNISAPLLEFDVDKYESDINDALDFEFFKYIIGDNDFVYKNPQFQAHLNAKTKMKEYKYSDALAILLDLEKKKSQYPYNVYLMLGVYADIDNCYKQLYDFENAYRYSAKRISLMQNLYT